ncbi:MAG: hypothetical protein R3F38_01830 [Gammaproteobacteria bacterium]
MTDKGATLNVSASQAMELASKAKDLVNGLDEKQKQQLKDSANKVAEQIKAMQQKRCQTEGGGTRTCQTE